MATTAAEISVQDANYDAPLVVRSTPRYRTLRLTRRDVFTSTVVPFTTPLLEAWGRQERVSSGTRPAGAHATTRALNVTVAAIALVIAAPVFLLVALAIKLASRGPVLYKQTRIGLDRRWDKAQSHSDLRVVDLGGRPFTMFKFRTMVTAAESDNREVWATRDDDRVTIVGRYLRATRLDELPQLLNVLSGDMNIVGPRPERPSIFAELRQVIPNYHLRQRVMPGIPGWAQINQAYDTSVDDVRRKVEFDLEYLSMRGVSRDLAIMARTVPIMLFCRLGW